LPREGAAQTLEGGDVLDEGHGVMAPPDDLNSSDAKSGLAFRSISSGLYWLKASTTALPEKKCSRSVDFS
jgi:hypothetical protein